MGILMSFTESGLLLYVTGNVGVDVTGNFTALSMRRITSLTLVKRLLSIRIMCLKSHIIGWRCKLISL
ncbi:hypothetical protein VCRA2120E57_80068 [Vibrio crassostreae]|nr:hypothetical protein VCRA2120E57_80068 [Vibrio crassostreae]